MARAHSRLGKTAGGLLHLATLVLASGTGIGAGAQLQGDVIKRQAESAAQGASGGKAPIPTAPTDRNKAATPRLAGMTQESRPVPMPGRFPGGLRDPFKLPPPPGPASESAAIDEFRGPLPPGTRGLVINQLRLEGIVRLDQSNTMIAVVSNYTNRAYFLRENDPVFNGVVGKITPDSISFRENYLDQYGRAQVREIVKRLSGAPGEGR